jgi:hypothetical protein
MVRTSSEARDLSELAAPQPLVRPRIVEAPVNLRPRRPVFRVAALALSALELALGAVLTAAFVLAIPMTCLTIAQVRFGYHTYALQTADMGDTLPKGSLVITHPVAAGRLVIGDVIAFHPPKQPAQLLTRRIVGIEDKGGSVLLVTKADTADARYTQSFLVSRSVPIDREAGYVPLAGEPVQRIQQPTLKLALLVLPLAVLLVLMTVQRLRRAALRRSRRGQ